MSICNEWLGIRNEGAYVMSDWVFVVSTCNEWLGICSEYM